MLLVVGNAATADGLFAAEGTPDPHDVGVLAATDRPWRAGGSAAAIAIAAARHYPTRLWHPLPARGSTQESDELRAALEAAAVDTAHCPTAPSVVRAVVVDTPQGRLAWSEQPAPTVIGADAAAALLQGVDHVVFAPRWGAWSDQIMRAARDAGIAMSIVGEVPPVQPGWAVAVADHRQLAALVPAATGIRVETRGAQGAVVSTADEQISVPAETAHVVDTTGAGDAFGGTFIAALLGGADLASAGAEAARAAAAACTHWGAIPADSHDYDSHDHSTHESRSMSTDQSTPLSLHERLNRTEGALWGQACGDAFGMPNSFLKLPIWRTGMEAGPVNSPYHAGYAPGRVTDDTEQAQSLTVAFEQSEGPLDVSIVAVELERWLDSVGGQDSLAVGPSTKRAMAAIKNGTPVELAGVSGVTNGAPMRIAVVGAWAALNDFTFDELLADVEAACVPTHNTSIAISGAAAVAAAVWAGIRGLGWSETLSQALLAARWGEERGTWIYGASVAERIIAAVDLAAAATSEVEATRVLSELIGMGEATTESVPAAFAAAAFAERNPEIAIRVAGNARGDTDTVAAMAGAIAGASTGPDLFPEAWKTAVAETNGLDVAAWSRALLRP
jgi:ADP-ribosylglycohydrolase/sugar/nucleoside kinase (ribokinase family)